MQQAATYNVCKKLLHLVTLSREQKNVAGGSCCIEQPTHMKLLGVKLIMLSLITLDAARYNKSKKLLYTEQQKKRCDFKSST